jgi:hypothetical protein
LESEKNLKVQNSNIPNAGKGLFAFNSKENENETLFRKGDKITTVAVATMGSSLIGTQACPGFGRLSPVTGQLAVGSPL